MEVVSELQDGCGGYVGVGVLMGAVNMAPEVVWKLFRDIRREGCIVLSKNVSRSKTMLSVFWSLPQHRKHL